MCCLKKTISGITTNCPACNVISFICRSLKDPKSNWYLVYSKSRLTFVTIEHENDSCQLENVLLKQLSLRWAFLVVRRPFWNSYYKMLREQISMYLPPEHLITTIWNNRIQDGCRIAEKFPYQDTLSRNEFEGNPSQVTFAYGRVRNVYSISKLSWETNIENLCLLGNFEKYKPSRKYCQAKTSQYRGYRNKKKSSLRKHSDRKQKATKSDEIVLTRYFYHLLLGELSLGKRALYAGKELKVKTPGRGIIRPMWEN